MIDEQFLETIPQYGIGGFVGKIFKNVKKSLKKVAPIIGGGIGFLIAGPVGAGIGSGIGGLVAGQDPAQALQTAALGYGIGNLAGSGLFGNTIQGWGGQGVPFTQGFGTTGGKWGMGLKGQKLPTNWGDKLYGQDKIFGSKTPPTLEEFAANKGIDITNPVVEKEVAKQYANSILSTGGKLPGGKLLGTAALAAGPLAYMAAKNEDEEAFDPYQLNPFYYQNPEEFQVANIADKPYYYPTLQDEAGYPVEDLPTDFVRSAEGGIIQLADGTKKNFPRRTGPINGAGTGTSDSIPAMLSDGEFVMTAEAVRNAGGGSRRQGAKKMYNMMKNLERRTA